MTDRPSTWRAPLAAAGAGILALAVLLWGGYARHWAWTGFGDNDTLWDWLHLLLLPVVFALLPLWLSRPHEMHPGRRRLVAGALAAFAVLVLLGYLVPMAWTGFPDNKLWDWLELVLLPIALIGVSVWVERGRPLQRRYVAAAGLGLLAFVVLVVVGYVDQLGWTGFPGNTLWDWLELLLLPLVVPLLLVPAALVWIRAEATEAGTAPERPGAESARAAPTAWLVAAGLAVGVGLLLGSQLFARHERKVVATPARAAAACVPNLPQAITPDSAVWVNHRGARYYACSGSKPAVSLSAAGSPSHFTVAGGRLVYADQRCSGSRCAIDIKVLRSGANAPFVRHHFDGTGGVMGIAVSPRGAVAVMLGAPNPQLDLIDGRGTRAVDGGAGLDTASLAGAGDSVYWRHAGRVMSATLSG